MVRFALVRISLLIPTFVGITLLAFFLIRLVPGDPIETMAGERGIDPVRHEQLRREFGLDQPILVQYGRYVTRVLHGDLGSSMVTRETVLLSVLGMWRPVFHFPLALPATKMGSPSTAWMRA